MSTTTLEFCKLKYETESWEMIHPSNPEMANTSQISLAKKFRV